MVNEQGRILAARSSNINVGGTTRLTTSVQWLNNVIVYTCSDNRIYYMMGDGRERPLASTDIHTTEPMLLSILPDRIMYACKHREHRLTQVRCWSSLHAVAALQGPRSHGAPGVRHSQQSQVSEPERSRAPQSHHLPVRLQARGGGSVGDSSSRSRLQRRCHQRADQGVEEEGLWRAGLRHHSQHLQQQGVPRLSPGMERSCVSTRRSPRPSRPIWLSTSTCSRPL